MHKYGPPLTFLGRGIVAACFPFLPAVKAPVRPRALLEHRARAARSQPQGIIHAYFRFPLVYLQWLNSLAIPSIC